MPSFHDLSEVVAHLSSRELPFACYFAEHPLAFSDGTPVPVLVRPRRGESWVSAPAEGVSGRPDEFDPERLVGLDVDDAARRANLAGWLVRAHEREALVTADYNQARLNLCYGDDRVVESVHRG